MRSGDVLVSIQATFEPRGADAAATEERMHFLIGKPFFKPHLLILCRVSPPSATRDIMIIHEETDEGRGVWSFCTSFQLAADLLQRHGGTCSAVSVCICHQLEMRSMNVVRMGEQSDFLSVWLYPA